MWKLVGQTANLKTWKSLWHHSKVNLLRKSPVALSNSFSSAFWSDAAPLKWYIIWLDPILFASYQHISFFLFASKPLGYTTLSARFCQPLTPSKSLAFRPLVLRPSLGVSPIIPSGSPLCQSLSLSACHSQHQLFFSFPVSFFPGQFFDFALFCFSTFLDLSGSLLRCLFVLK